MDFEQIDQIAQKAMRYRKSHFEREIGAAYFHGTRVANGVIALRKLLTEDDSMDDTLRVAALFHDVAKGMEPHARLGALLTRELLRDELSEEALCPICRLIAAHDCRRPGTDEHDLWEKLLQDADILDHYGAQGVWMSCIYYAYHDQQEMGQLPLFYKKEWPEQIKRSRSLLNFSQSQAIFDEKCAFEIQVARRMAEEAKGNYVS